MTPVFPSFDVETMVSTQSNAGEAGRRRSRRRVMLAVLTDAIDLVLQEPAPPASRRARLQREAAAWMRADDTGWFLSFLNVCATLGVDAGRLRTAMLPADPRPRHRR